MVGMRIVFVLAGFMSGLCGVVGCGSDVASSCVGDACGSGGTIQSGDDDVGDDSSGTSTGSTGVDDSDGDDSDTDDPGPVCIGGGPGVFFCDTPWSCEDDSECPKSMICNQDYCEPARSCDVKEDCSPDELCVEGICRVPSCEVDADCEGNDWCLGEACVAATGVLPCAVATSFDVATLEVMGPEIADVAAMGVAPVVAIARGDGSVDLVALGELGPTITATVSTQPADASRIAFTAAFGGPMEPDLLSVGPEVVLNRSSGDLASPEALEAGDAIDIAAFGGASAAVSLHRDGASASLRDWLYVDDALVPSEPVSTLDDAFSVDLLRDGIDLLVVSPGAAAVHAGLGLDQRRTLVASAEHPLLAGALASNGGNEVIALVAGGADPGVWVDRDAAPALLASLAVTPTAVALADADGQGALDLVLAHTSGLTWIRDVDAEACAQDLPLPVAPTRLAFADLDGDGDLELVATGGTSLFVVRAAD
jgi:hypothetical protein